MKFKKILFLFSLVSLYGATEKESALVALRQEIHSLIREKALLEDRAERLQFEKGSLQESKELYSRIDYLQLQLNELLLKIEKAEKKED